MDKHHEAILNTLRQHEPHGLTYRQVWSRVPHEIDVNLKAIRTTLATMEEEGFVRFARGRWHAVAVIPESNSSN